MRQSIDKYFMDIAKTVSSRATCIRRKVGAVIVDSQNHILSTGYNGTPRNASHCIINPCGGTKEKSGEGLDKCESIHAETNAIAQCDNLRNAHTIYVTTSPCISCMKLILATTIRKIYYDDYYDSKAIQYFKDNGGIIIQLN